MSAYRRRIRPNEVLDILDEFLDPAAFPWDRLRALRHEDVPDGLLTGFIRTLDVELRLLALDWCDRPRVLAEWARIGSEQERAMVAGSFHVDLETLLRLAGDPAEYVRREVVLNPSSDVEILASLVDDPSVVVQVAMDLLKDRECEDFASLDDEPGGEDTLAFLHSEVPDAEVEDLIDEHFADQAQEYRELCLRESLPGGGLDLEDDLPTADVERGAEVEPMQDSPTLSEGQLLGLLAYHLGARRI